MFFVVFIFSLVVLVATGGISLLIMNLKEIPFLLWACLINIGWGFFHIFYGIGWVLAGIATLALIVKNFFAAYGLVILKWIGIVIGFVAGGTVLTVGGIKFGQTKLGKRFVDFLAFKLNGFSKAREENRKRRAELRQKLAEEEAAKPKIEKKPTKPFFIFRMWDWLKETFVTGRYVRGEDGFGRRELGLLPLIWQYIIGIYKGVCPIAEIVDPQTLVATTEDTPEVEEQEE